MCPMPSIYIINWFGFCKQQERINSKNNQWCKIKFQQSQNNNNGIIRHAGYFWQNLAVLKK